MNDLRSRLKTISFPEVVAEALKQIQKLWVPFRSSYRMMDIVELCREFVFFEVPQHGKEPIRHIKELQILYEICKYFENAQCEDDIFVLLFPIRLQDKRIRLLNKLVSLSIALGNGKVLSCIGKWMQLSGCASDHCISLTNSVLKELFRVSTYKSDQVRLLPNYSGIFCSSLATSILSIYVSEPPPDHILEVILEWLKLEPSICFAPFCVIPPSICKSFVGFQCPLPQLVHWCILHPCKPSSDVIARHVYFELHVLCLNLLANASNYFDTNKYEALPIEKIEHTVSVLKSIKASDDKMLSVERLAQVMQAGLDGFGISHHKGKLGKLFVYCIDLPYHQLLKIVLQKWSYEMDMRDR